MRAPHGPLVHVVRARRLQRALVELDDDVALDEERRPRRRGDDEAVLVVARQALLVAPRFDDLVPAHDLGEEALARHAGGVEGGRRRRRALPLRARFGELDGRRKQRRRRRRLWVMTIWFFIFIITFGSVFLFIAVIVVRIVVVVRGRSC